MTNNIEVADKLLNATDYKMLNILGVFRNVLPGLRKLHTTFGVFRLFSLPTKKLISRVNMLFQHYHVSTNLSRKLDALLRYLQLQLGTPQNPLTLDFAKWGHLAPLSLTKNALEVTAPLKYTTVNGLPNNTQSERAGPSNYGYLLLASSRLRRYQKFEQM
jgi:hypothetical protein